MAIVNAAPALKPTRILSLISEKHGGASQRSKTDYPRCQTTRAFCGARDRHLQPQDQGSDAERSHRQISRGVGEDRRRLEARSRYLERRQVGAGSGMSAFVRRRGDRMSAPGKLVRSSRWKTGPSKGQRPLGSECCVTPGDSGHEAYTAIAWGVGLSHERSDIAGAEGFHSLEGNMCGTVRRGADALPGSKATSRAKGSHRNLGGLGSGHRRRVGAEYDGPHREG